MNILLVFCWSTTNIGDIVITPGTLELLHEHFPGAKVTVIGSQLGEKSELSERNLKALTTRPYTFVPNPFGDIMQGDHLQAYAYASQAYFESGRFLKRLHRSSPDAARAFLEADLVLLNPGMMLTLNNQGAEGQSKRLLTFWIPLLLAAGTGTPFALWGQSCGPLEWPGTEMARRFLPQSCFITTRETRSLEFLQRLGIRGPRMAFAPDTTIHFDRRDDAWADAFLARHGLEPEKFLTVIVRTYGWWQKPIEGERLERHMQTIADVISGWVRDTGLPVAIVPEVQREIPRAREHLLPRLPDEVRARCAVFEGYWLPDQAKALYRRTRALVSMELHSILLSLPEGTPIVHVYFDEMGPKTWAVKDAGLEDFLFDIDSCGPEEIGEALRRIHNDRAAISERVLAGARYFRETGHARMRELKETLGDLARG